VGDTGGLSHKRGTLTSLGAHLAAARLDSLQTWGARLSLGGLALFALDTEGKNAIEEAPGAIAVITRALSHTTDMVAASHGLELVCTLCEANECRALFVEQGLHCCLIDQFIGSCAPPPPPPPSPFSFFDPPPPPPPPSPHRAVPFFLPPRHCI
jgi:hypothetical protein